MRFLWVVAGVLVLDQVTKLIVRLNMDMGHIGAIDLIGDWLKFTYTENPGMAFGINFGPPGLITGFSIIAAAMIAIYLLRIRKCYMPYTVSLACILGGATGNIIDRLFYGMIFDYGPFFQGRVVDFIHFDIWYGRLPSSIPFIGDTYLSFFPIFNVADIGIVGGVIGILLFQQKFLNRLHGEQEAGALDLPTEVATSAPVQEKQIPLSDQNPSGEGSLNSSSGERCPFLK
ncbi:MAG: signal peptidase II [Bacteroidetes bacterium]|nr:signal peptidase II [Bacteroidota bacterium]MCY4204569.1 signal peptidase II [Bacteroidota bacterium]